MLDDLTNIVRIIRFKYFDDTTIGKVALDGEPFCYSLEDAVRPENVKIKGKTAILPGKYVVEMTYSPKYERDMPHIRNVVGFKGVRIHGGNDHEDTEGCPLFAANWGGQKTIWGSKSEDFRDWLVSVGGKALLVVENLTYWEG